MWNLTFNNRVCNEHERFRDHRTHVNKLLVTKSWLDTKTPYKPGFLNCKAGKVQSNINSNIKINYENSNLLGKITSIERHYSTYHPKRIIVKECPAYNKTDFVKATRQKSIDRENIVSEVLMILLLLIIY